MHSFILHMYTLTHKHIHSDIHCIIHS